MADRDMARKIDTLQGTLDLLILRTLALGPLHGWAVAHRIEQVTGHVLQVPQGSLYPALHRLEADGLIKAEWGTVEDSNRQAKFYTLTAAGKRQLATQSKTWSRLVGAVDQILTQS